MLINLRTVREARAVVVSPTETRIGGGHPKRAGQACGPDGSMGRVARSRCQCGDAADPQCGHAGREHHATLLVLVLSQWLPCFKAGGSHCFSEHGEHQQHAIFGGGPSFSVHPSIWRCAGAGGAGGDIRGPGAGRATPLAAAELFVLPSQNPARENTLGAMDLLTGVHIPTPAVDTVSTYLKITDRAAWTHAEVSVAVVLQVEGRAYDSQRGAGRRGADAVAPARGRTVAARASPVCYRGPARRAP